jgi:hypothetical protein
MSCKLAIGSLGNDEREELVNCRFKAPISQGLMTAVIKIP